MVPSFKFVIDVAEGVGTNSQKCLAGGKPWVDPIQEFELVHGPLAQHDKTKVQRIPVGLKSMEECLLS